MQTVMIVSVVYCFLLVHAVVPAPSHNGAVLSPSSGSNSSVVGGVGSPWCMVNHHNEAAYLTPLAIGCVIPTKRLS